MVTTTLTMMLTVLEIREQPLPDSIDDPRYGQDQKTRWPGLGRLAIAGPWNLSGTPLVIPSLLSTRKAEGVTVSQDR
jgi:hypothetical protein